MTCAYLERSRKTFVVVRRRQADVHDRDVRRIALHHEQQIVGRLALCDDLEFSVCQKPRKSFSQKDTVLGDRYPHGSSARTRVPPPAGLQTRSTPPRASTLSASPRKPEPPSLSAPPAPSSTTSTTNSVPIRLRVTLAEEAPACLLILARLSETT